VRQERSRPPIVELKLTHNTKDNVIPGQFHTNQTTKTISYRSYQRQNASRDGFCSIAGRSA